MLEGSRWTTRRSIRGALGLIAVATFATGCGAFPTPTTTTVTQTATVARTVTSTATTTVTAPAPVTAVQTQSAQSAKIKVPSAVGKDYQSAQDLWRGLGLVVGVAKDATGAHRIPILDSNWVVVSQEPAAGTEVAQGTVITATVKKYSDD